MTHEPAGHHGLLSVRGLHAGYGEAEAVSDVSLSIAPGSIVAIVGANGAGKSTLLNAMMGLLPSKGSIRFDGIELHGSSVEARVVAGLSLVPETRELFGEMSVEDNLAVGAFTAWRRGRFDLPAALETVYARFGRLRERRAQIAQTLSGGERQMLAIGRALLARPRVLLLDEPSLGLAPLIVRDIFEIVSGLRSSGVSILLVEQNARAALRIADHAYVMENGRMSLEGPAAEVARDPSVVSAYLGSRPSRAEVLSTKPDAAGSVAAQDAAPRPPSQR